MNRGEFRRHLYNRLGERTPGFWQIDPMNDILQQAANRHAREGLSVERSRKANSLPGVQEYDFPDNYGELIAVRYNDESYGYEGDQLTLVDKSAILDAGYNYNFLGYPQFYYVFDDGFGLFPVPNRPPIFSYKFTGTQCPFFTAPQDLDLNTIYRTRIDLDLDPEEEVDDDCYVFVSHIGLFLRRQGAPYPGDLRLAMSQLDENGNVMFRVDSEPIFAEEIGSRPEWYTFDFSDSPLELISTVKQYDMWLYTNSEYAQTLVDAPEGRGIYIGSQPQRIDGVTVDTAFFELHRLRNDIEIDFWASETQPMLTDDDSPEQAPRFHEDIFEIALADCWAVGGRNMRLAQYHESRAVDRINQSRTRQLKKAHGRRIRTERISLNNVPYANYDATSDTFTISVLGY